MAVVKYHAQSYPVIWLPLENNIAYDCGLHTAFFVNAATASFKYVSLKEVTMVLINDYISLQAYYMLKRR